MVARRIYRHTGHSRRTPICSLLYVLSLLLVFQLLGHGELDDPFPIKGARMAGAKSFKSDSRGAVGQSLQVAEAAGGAGFAVDFYLTSLVPTPRSQRLYSPVIGWSSSRAPPLA